MRKKLKSPRNLMREYRKLRRQYMHDHGFLNLNQLYADRKISWDTLVKHVGIANRFSKILR